MRSDRGRRLRPCIRGYPIMSQVKRKAVSGKENLDPEEIDAGGPAINDYVQEQIGSKLKALFDEPAKQPVPDRFVELLQALAKKEDGPDAN